MRRFVAAVVGVSCAVSVAACSDSPGVGGDSPSSSGAAPSVVSSASPTPPSPAPAVAQGCAAVDQLVADRGVEALAPRLLGVGVTDFESAAQAVDLGVRHLFIGSQTDRSLLNGQGDPERSLAALERRAGEKLTVSVDEEGGEVQRLASVAGEVPSAQRVAATMSPQQAQEMMAEHGRKLRALGITVDFAPVLDLAGGESIADNAIGSRAFSADPAVVVEYARAYAQGLLSAGVQPVFKHFPGHGHATGDSHLGAVTTPPLERMNGLDMRPFAELLGIPGVAVMVSHVETPGLGDGSPSSVNPAVYELLRAGGYGQPGAMVPAPPFEGVIYTDDMTGMKAVSDRYPGTEGIVKALQSGTDVSLAAAGAIDVSAAVDAVREAIKDGRLPEDRVRAAVGCSCRV